MGRKSRALVPAIVVSCSLAIASCDGDVKAQVRYVIGLSEGKAKRALEDDGYKVRSMGGGIDLSLTMGDATDNFCAAGKQVIEQSPDAGLEAPPGSTVSIQIDCP